MKNLGRLSFFLDIGFEKGDDFVKKNQRRYFSKVLERFEMSNCKSRTTPSEQKLEFGRLYNSNKLTSLRVDELSLYFSHQKLTFKRKKAEKVAMIKVNIGSLLYNSMEHQQPRQSPLRIVSLKVTSSLSEVETDSQSDVVDRAVGSSPCSLSDEVSPESDFIPELHTETSKYGRKWAQVKKDNYVSREKIVFYT